MKVLIVGAFIEPPFSDGIVNSVFNWAKALCYAGNDVRVLSISSDYSGQYKLLNINFKYVKTKNPRFQSNLVDALRLQKETLKQLNGEDVIHLAYGADGISTIPILTMLHFLRRKIVNSYYSNYLPRSTSLFRNLMFDMITVPSKRMFKTFLEKKICPQKIRIVPPCVDTEKFRPKDKIKIREKLGLSINSFTVFTVGHFKYRRRLIPLIKTIRELSNNGKKIQLLIGWTGYGEKDCIKEVFSIARKNNFVRIIPPTNNINLYYNAADIYVLSSCPDCVKEIPMSIIEALSSGIPVITFNINAASEIVRNNVNGYLIKDGDFAEIKVKLKYLMRNEHILKEFSANARISSLNKFSLRVIGNHLFRVYRELIDNHD